MSERSGRMDGQQEREAGLRASAHDQVGIATADVEYARGNKMHVIESNIEVISSILRPLAELTVPCPECQGTGERWVIGQGTVRNHDKRNLTVAGCSPTLPDPRFAALRRPSYVREGLSTEGERKQGNYEWWPGGIDASLGAIVRAAAACGFHVGHMGPTYDDPQRWAVAFWTVTPHKTLDVHTYKEGEGATPEEAATLALVAALGDEKPHTATGQLTAEEEP